MSIKTIDSKTEELEPISSKVGNEKEIIPAPPFSPSEIAQKALSEQKNDYPENALDAVALALPPLLHGEKKAESLLEAFTRSLDLGPKKRCSLKAEVPSHNYSSLEGQCQGVLSNTHFDPALSTSPEFRRLVQMHGLLNVAQAINSIEEQVKGHLREDEFIMKGLAMIEHVLSEGQRFSGVPEILGAEADGSPKLVWRKDKGSASPIVERGLHFASAEIKEKHDQKARKEEFKTKMEMTAAFNYFKKSLPTSFLEDGCDMRCLWISFLLENYFKVGNEKIKVSHSEGKFLQIEPPFAKGRVNWKMHTAPVVACEGKKYIFDVSMDKPMLYDDWLNNLHPVAEQRIIFASPRWDEECCHPTQHNKSINLEEQLADLRGLYLFETVDANMTQLDGKIRRSRGWMSWIKEQRGFVPVAKAMATDLSGNTLTMPVLVELKKVEGQKFIPVFETLPVSKDFITGVTGIIFADQSLKTKYEIFAKTRRLATE